MCQRTSGSGTLKVKPVSAGLAKQLGRMVEDAMPNYPGGLASAELVKGDPEFIAEFYKFCDDRAAKRAETLAWQDRPVWKIVTVGTHQTKDELKKAVTDEGHKFSDRALGLINTDRSFTWNAIPTVPGSAGAMRTRAPGGMPTAVWCSAASSPCSLALFPLTLGLSDSSPLRRM